MIILLPLKQYWHTQGSIVNRLFVAVHERWETISDRAWLFIRSAFSKWFSLVWFSLISWGRLISSFDQFQCSEFRTWRWLSPVIDALIKILDLVQANRLLLAWLLQMQSSSQAPPEAGILSEWRARHKNVTNNSYLVHWHLRGAGSKP